MPENDIAVAEEVRAALADGGAVVALESSLIANGLPHPDGVETGLSAAAAVRGAGAVPATVALIGGTIRVGLEAEDLDRLGAQGAAKCAARDIAALVAAGRDGGTTVSATARIAAACGIRFFGTGGIGGVHRRFGGADEPLDVSADLPEFARAPVAVVSSGAKAILDLPATMEMLETLGVPVVALGDGRLPAFYAADSGLRVPHTVADAAGAARLAAAHWRLRGAGGLLICNPPPADVAMSRERQEELVGQALAAARQQGIRGAAVTPFVLAEIRRLSDDETLTINKALVIENARLAARIAVEFCRLP
jgi:pseudouridine-5'-phosphate glycosidase